VFRLDNPVARSALDPVRARLYSPGVPRLAELPMTTTPDRARRALDRLRPGVDRLCRLYRVLEATRPDRIVGDQSVDPTYFALLVEVRSTLHRVGRDWQALEQGPALAPRRPLDPVLD
jgi:hypothetical protein